MLQILFKGKTDWWNESVWWGWGDSKIVVGKTVNLMWQRGGGSILGKISMTSFMNPPSCAK